MAATKGLVVYSMDSEIAQFFEQTSVPRSVCDSYAKEELGGEVVPVAVQGVCSYTVYAGPKGEFVAQFRLKSLQLRMETAELAQAIYGDFAPQVAFRGQIGDDGVKGKDPLYIYVMSRMQGISYLTFLLAHSTNIPENSCKFSFWRRNLISDIARFFARSWNSPQTVSREYRDGLRRQYEKELGLLLVSLPDRFHPLIQQSLDSLPAIFSLPMVLLHRDFGICNIMVNEDSCHLVGVVDWAESEITCFGLNLYSIQQLISTVHLRNGWTRFADYGVLEDVFWSTLRAEAGGLSSEIVEIVKSARVMGLLLSRGFTSRLANMPEPVPVRDDEGGAYNIRDLDGLLINPATRFTELV
ncbi:hypothetical protein UA08_03473 [Talaromyces atroroseus]|uniref:Aminoglycoside phosphotransferase domain-containing protein n=1 Tax=Talaromyces atroroseus TaxID=1441469 RepID=A0A225ANV3_TALAT|nr:hypothetical protein UA08_03473 [Talaromyces atroroseus]OKL61153.1 hypothetical protein UA08_03473 [Talaromyces atroroseus]